MSTFERKTEKISYKDSQKAYQSTYYTELNNASNVSTPIDYSTPYSFNEWIRTQDAVEPNSQYEFYLQYIVEWYKNKFTKAKANEIIKTNYVNLLKQLNIVFKDEVNENWFTSLSYDNDLDIQDMIDFYSKKLKQIAYFLAEKRETIKRAKLKYNTVGSNFGTIKLFTDYILNTFTQRQYAYNTPTGSDYKNMPAISGVNTSFQMYIKELYDDSNYFDRSPTASTTVYTNITSESVNNLMSSMDLSLEDAEWVYSLGKFDSIDSSTTYTNLSDELLISLTEKYIGTAIYNGEVIHSTVDTITAVVDLVQGNNWFYWPSGEHLFESSYVPINNIPLSATTLLSPLISTESIQITATAGNNYKESDRIFVLDYNGIKGAWAQSVSSETTVETMSALINGTSTYLFKFPYPGYGEGSKTLPWTGKSKQNITSIYNFLDFSTKQYIKTQYFADTSTEIYPVTPISINNSNIVRCGAYASKEYNRSDQIRKFNSTNADKIHDSIPNAVYTDDIEYAWLYDVTKTNLAANIGATNILWPLQTYINAPDTSFVTPSDYCSPIPLSSLNHNHFIGSRSGSGLYDSDIIYVLDGVNGAAIQAAFLSSGEIKHNIQPIIDDENRFTAEISGAHQPGLYLKCFPGQYATFIWGDVSIDINDTNITYHNIPTDSEYRNVSHFSIYESRLKPLQEIYSKSIVDNNKSFTDFGIGPGVGDWKLDSSRSVLFSPIGHPGDVYDDFDKMTDIIFVDHNFPNPFSLASWRDDQGRSYKTSPDFGWYKLDSENLLQPDVGWGPGQWVNYNGTTSFKLSAGYQYKYLRANLRRSASEIQMHAVPYMVIKQPYTIANTKWVKAVYDGSKFLPTNEDTDIILSPGSIISYDHYNVTSYCLTSVDTRGQAIDTNYYKACSTDFKAWIDYNLLEDGSVFNCIWPRVLFYETSSTGPSPVNGSTSFDKIQWTVTNNKGFPTRSINTDPAVTFTMAVSTDDSPTVYDITAKGLSGTTITETQYLQVTAIPVTTRYTISGTLTYETIQSNTIPVDICVPLSGWNPDTKSIELTYPHAQPIWVKSVDENEESTKNKGIPISDRQYSFEHEIILKFMPPISDIIFDTNTTIEYKRNNTKDLIWIQSLTYNNNTPVYKWSKLIIDSDISPLSAFSCESFTVPRVIQSDEDSDIILSAPNDTGIRKQYINYYAINDVKWYQPLSLKRQPLTSTSVLAITSTIPEYEIGNILNRHYPTVASIPNINNLVDEDSIGIYKPNNLGLPIYLGKSHTTEVCANSGEYYGFINPNVFESDYGFTRELNISPFMRYKYNASWMKTPATFIAKSGVIQNSKPYEKFNPYQNKYEIIGRNSVGINYTKDVTDPWHGDIDSDWRPTVPDTVDIRGLHNINHWLNTFVTPLSTQVYNWGTDIFGNNYALLKNIQNIDVYNQQFVGGCIWVRTIDDELKKGTDILSSIYSDYTSASGFYNDIISDNIQKLVLIEDYIITATSHGIGISRIEYDYDTKTIKTNRNQYVVYDFTELSLTEDTVILGNILYIPQNRTILFPTSINPNRIEMLEYSIQDNILRRCLNSEMEQVYEYIDDQQLDELTAPVITYNNDTKLYNISFIARKNTEFDGDHLISIIFEYIQNNYNIKNINKLTPS